MFQALQRIGIKGTILILIQQLYIKNKNKKQTQQKQQHNKTNSTSKYMEKPQNGKNNKQE